MTPLDSDAVECRLLIIGLSFGWLGALSLFLQTGAAAAPIAMLALSLGVGVLHVQLRRVAPGRDPLLLPATVLLCAWGALVIARVAPNFALRQVGAVAISLFTVGIIAAGHDRLRWLRRFKYTWLLIAFALLAATLFFGVNPSGGPARLWLSIGSLFFQPSELLRLLLIAFWAAFLSESESEHVIKGPLTPAVAMWLVAVGLLASQQDFGAASLLLLSFVVMLYLATGRRQLPLALIAAFIAAGAVGYQLSTRVAIRVDTWLNPAVDPQGRSFQIMQSLIAAASGGWFGAGLNQGRPDYVPAVHTDFPFIAVAEEFGLIGALIVLAIFALLCARAWRIVLRSPSPYTQLLAGGIAASLAIQVAVIVGGNLAMLPLTGVTLPFISYGGSSLLAWMIAIGLLLRLSADGTANPPPYLPPSRPLRITAAATLSIFVLLALWTTLTMAVRAPALTARRDNPRLIDDERAVLRGEIRARDGTVLAFSTAVPSISGRTVYSRTYPIPAAAPVVGYYSLRYGASGLEEWADAALRGSLSATDRLLHRPQIGGPITTTLDVAEQRAAMQSLAGRIGAAIVLDARDGGVLALASSPGYDPNQLDAEWNQLRNAQDAPLLNRTTQALYQPGPLLQWLYKTTPAAFVWDTHDTLSLGKPLTFELPNSFVPWPTTATFSETIGQGQLRVTPLRIAFTLAHRSNPALESPTLIAARTHATSIAPLPDLNFETVAQIGPRHFVVWRVRCNGYVVRVSAEEVPSDE